MSTNHDKSLRDHLLHLLKGGGAHVGFDDAVADIPALLRGKKIESLPYTATYACQFFICF